MIPGSCHKTRPPMLPMKMAIKRYETTKPIHIASPSVNITITKLNETNKFMQITTFLLNQIFTQS